MKLTKLQRHTAYIIMLAEYECDYNKRKNDFSDNWYGKKSSTDSGFCMMLDVLFGEDFYFTYDDGVFPELKKRETQKKHAWKIKDNKERIIVLKKSIKETY